MHNGPYVRNTNKRADPTLSEVGNTFRRATYVAKIADVKISDFCKIAIECHELALVRRELVADIGGTRAYHNRKVMIVGNHKHATVETITAMRESYKASIEELRAI